MTAIEQTFERESGLSVSFEFFPPKTEKMEERLWETVERLEPISPSFVSVTYGAGGSTRERTHGTVRRIAQETSLRPAGHLTCVSATKEEVLAVAEDYWQAGVKHIVALRGDPPEGMGAKFEPHPGGFRDSIELVEGLRAHRPSWASVSRSPYPAIRSFIRKARAGMPRLPFSRPSRMPALTVPSRSSSLSRRSI